MIPRPTPAMLRIHACLLAAWLLFFAVIVLLVTPVRAHDFWINKGGYNGPDGVHCCGPNDCFEVPKEAVRITPNGYLVSPRRVLGPPEVIRNNPESEVVPFHQGTPSEDGKYWRCQRVGGDRRCFFAPVGSG
jgi:hypothetical protein